MAITGDQLGSYISPALDALTGFFWPILQFGFLLVGLYYLWVFTSFNKKVMLREMTKGNRTIVKIVRAKIVKEKNLQHPQLQLFGTFGFQGKRITQPPSDCIYPYKSTFGNTTLYDFVVKDDIHYPISNTVLGRKYVLTGENQEEVDSEVIDWAKEKGYAVAQNPGESNVVYSLDGSGLETSRDFDAEQGTLNDLISAAEKYKNRKPGEVYMLYGVVILAIVGGFITVVYSLFKAGQVTEAVNQGWELFRQWTEIAEAGKKGPG